LHSAQRRRHGRGGHGWTYEIERIDLAAIVERFFFDTDFLMGPELLQADEKSPGFLNTTPEARRIAAGLKPGREDLVLRRASEHEMARLLREPPASVPKSGYVGPYPLRERSEGDDPP